MMSSREHYVTDSAPLAKKWIHRMFVSPTPRARTHGCTLHEIHFQWAYYSAGERIRRESYRPRKEPQA